MGAASSSNLNKFDEEITEKKMEDMVNLVLPLYYTTELLTPVEYDLVHSLWEMVLNNTAPEFVQMRKDPSFHYSTCIAFFYDTYYHRLFDVHPLCRDLFTDVAKQGKFLVKMISLALSEKQDPQKYEQTLIKLAFVHNELGVKAMEYGLVGDVLFYTLKRCVGPSIYTSEAHQGWVKVISRMLHTMVPLAVAHEMKIGTRRTRGVLLARSLHIPSQSIDPFDETATVMMGKSSSQSCPLGLLNRG
eukprot:gene648-703_t